MKNAMQHIRASLEEAGLIADPVVEEVMEEVMVSEEPTVQDAELELVEAAGEVEEATEAVEILEKAAATMESIAISIEEIVEAGGELAPEVVDQIEDRVEEVLEDVGLAPEQVEEVAEVVAEVMAEEVVEEGATDVKEELEAAAGADEVQLVSGDVDCVNEVCAEPVVQVMASTESFAADRRTASMESLDKLKDFLHKLWMGIRAAVLKAYETVGNFFAALFDATGRVTKRITQLRGALKGIEGKKAKEGIAFRSAHRLAFGGKFSATSVKEGLASTLAAGGKVFGAYADGVNALSNAIAGDSAAIPNDVQRNISAVVGQKLSGDYQFVESKVGAVTVPTLQAPEQSLSVVNAIAPLTAAEITSVLVSVEKLNTLIAGKKDKVKQMKAASDAMVKKLDADLAAADKNAAMKAADRIKLRARMVLGGKAWTRPITQYSSHAFGTIRAALVLVERSIAAYKEEPKAA